MPNRNLRQGGVFVDQHQRDLQVRSLKTDLPRVTVQPETIMRKLILATLALTVAAPSAPAFADPPPWAKAHGRRAKERASGDWHRYRHYDYDRYEPGYRAYYADRYYRPGRYYQTRRLGYGDRIYRGRDGRYYCRRSDGTTGLIIGGALGALLGRELDRGQSRTLGTILGAAGGAMIGRELARDVRCR